MSRIQVFDKQNYKVGELQANMKRDWSINTVTQGTFKLAIPQLREWITFGNMVLVEDEFLPPWVGMIDPPWTATAPIAVTAYSAECLFAIRVPNVNTMPIKWTGTGISMLQQAIADINSQEDTMLRSGVMLEGSLTMASASQDVECRDYLTIIKDILARDGLEMNIRPVVSGGRLYLYVDASERVGVDTQVMLGRNNSKITQIKVDGKLYNRMSGWTEGATWTSRTRYTGERLAEQSAYRLRSSSMTTTVKDTTTLQTTVEAALNVSAPYYTDLTIDVPGVGDILSSIRIGNSMQVAYADGIYMPGAVSGISGTIRIKTMSYDDGTNLLTMTGRIQ